MTDIFYIAPAPKVTIPLASDLRYFEIKVTGCKNCPKYKSVCCGFEFAPYQVRSNAAKQNYDHLTPSCPNWNETKEQK